MSELGLPGVIPAPRRSSPAVIGTFVLDSIHYKVKTF